MEMIAPPVLEARELYRFFHAGDDETFALRGVSMSVEAGEVVAIVGPSGSGKSTLLACLAGLDEPDGGYVVISGARITRRPEPVRASLRARFIGILLQSGNLINHLTVEQNIAMAGRMGDGERRVDPGEILRSVGLESRRHARPSTLSGGEAARAGLAVALANDPPVLLADEPTGEVDAETEAVVLELLRARANAGKAVLVVSHSAHVASAADRVLRVGDGRLVRE
jgi:putative ABC transport system ATP-binding protein